MLQKTAGPAAGDGGPERAGNYGGKAYTSRVS